MYSLLPSYTGLEEGEESPTSEMDRRLGCMCPIYNSALNVILENDSFQHTNG